MLKAYDVEAQTIVKAALYGSAHEIRLKHGPGRLVCPYCRTNMFVREREGFVLHFVHTSTCTATIDRHPESPEHEQGKLALAQYLKSKIKGDEAEAQIEVEYRLDDCGENGRIADVAIVYQNGNILVAECQLARISIDELKARTTDYLSIGVDVLWFLGGEADTSENRSWLRSMFGSTGRIEFDYSAEKTVYRKP